MVETSANKGNGENRLVRDEGENCLKNFVWKTEDWGNSAILCSYLCWEQRKRVVVVLLSCDGRHHGAL